VGDKIAPKLAEAVEASRALLGFRLLLSGLALASAAWFAECSEYWLAFHGFGQGTMDLGVAVFGYAFSTVAGIVSPGGLGPTDVGLIEIAKRFTPGMQTEVATAASFIVRVCTLWFAVGLGAIALMRFRKLVDVDVEAARGGGDPGQHAAAPASSPG